MVRILANGEIVPDDDPRARQATGRNTSNTRNPQAGNIHQPQQYQGQNHAAGQQVSIFHALNQRLLGLGIPPWNIGQTRIEPIVSVGFLLSFMLFGLPGVIFGGVLFAVSKWSQDGAPQFLSGLFGNNRAPDRRDGTGSGSNQNTGGGYRLGHS